MIEFKEASKIDEVFIQNVLSYCIEKIKTDKSHPIDLKIEGVKNIYFAGRTLFIDTIADYPNPITICQSDETIGFFGDCPLRRLLSIKTLKLVEELMIACGVTHTSKWYKRKSLMELFKENHINIHKGNMNWEVLNWSSGCFEH